MHVYRVESLSNPKNKFRVDINAQENRLSGESLVPFSVVFLPVVARFSGRDKAGDDIA